MNDICVFLGATLTLSVARDELDAVYLPPASHGDVYRLWQRRPRAIGLIDGYSEHVPAVWHKEIMWIMEQGVHVFGSADLGALRAVELEPFGMRGAGWVFQSFKDGALDQDDEVATVYERGPDGYCALSEAMVNIRQTLLAAWRQQIISQATRDVLTSIAKTFFYQDRNWLAVLKAGEVQCADPAELIMLRRWLPGGRIDQKADDAVAMLREMRVFLATDPEPLHVRWRMANTMTWNTARCEADRAFEGAPDSALLG
jgi:hypothetical protein